MAAEYYASSFREFKEMGMDELAVSVLKEGLQAHPLDEGLAELSRENGLGDEVRLPAKAPTEQITLEQLLTGSISTMKPQTQRPAEEDEIVPAENGDEFWSALRSQKLKALLLERGGLIRVSDFLPKELAEKTFATMQSLQPGEWSESNSSLYDDKGQYGDKSASHWFYRYDGDKLDETVREIQSIGSGFFPSFQAAKYETSGNLSAHDDSNYFREYPAGQLLFRKIAVIYYLTKDWRQECHPFPALDSCEQFEASSQRTCLQKKDYGGALLDLHGETKQLLPRFNSLVAFLVPRVHQVEELAAGCPPRFSIFGWFSDTAPYPNEEGVAKRPWLSTMDSRGLRTSSPDQQEQQNQAQRIYRSVEGELVRLRQQHEELLEKQSEVERLQQAEILEQREALRTAQQRLRTAQGLGEAEVKARAEAERAALAAEESLGRLGLEVVRLREREASLKQELAACRVDEGQRKRYVEELKALRSSLAAERRRREDAEAMSRERLEEIRQSARDGKEAEESAEASRQNSQENWRKQRALERENRQLRELHRFLNGRLLPYKTFSVVAVAGLQSRMVI
eukprot:s4628_g2.t1